MWSFITSLLLLQKFKYHLDLTNNQTILKLENLSTFLTTYKVIGRPIFKLYGSYHMDLTTKKHSSEQTTSQSKHSIKNCYGLPPYYRYRPLTSRMPDLNGQTHNGMLTRQHPSNLLSNTQRAPRTIRSSRLFRIYPQYIGISMTTQ